MSIPLMLSLWKANLSLTPLQRLVLECLAYYTNDETNDCFPSYNTIANKCCMCRNSVIKAIKQLCFMKILSIENIQNPHSGKTSNHYKINIDLIKSYNPICTNLYPTVPRGALPYTTTCTTLVHGVHYPSAPRAPYLINDLIIDLKEYIVKPEEKSPPEPESPSSLALRNSAKLIIDFLKLKTGSNFGYTETAMKLITGRLKEGVTVEQCKQVIARKQMEWGNDKVMKKFVRPTTLFNKTNLHDKYLPELVTEEERKKIMNRG